MIIAAKLIGSLFYPLSVVLLALAAALLLARRRPRTGRALAAFALIWLWLWSTPFVAERAAGRLERDFPPVPAHALPQADAIVVLGGLMLPAAPPAAPHPDLNAAADRAWHAARLYRAGRAPTVICSGGRAPLSRAAGPECPDIAQLLIELGVPMQAIVQENASATTRQNAEQVARLLPAGARVLLVTSALHMPRALRAFAQAGIDATPAATDHVRRAGQPLSLRDLLPSADALARSSAVWHEWLGRLWYR